MAEPTAGQAAPERTLVNYEVKDGVAYLTLNDPPANTYTHEMMRQLDGAILEARFDESVHVIVLTGLGEKFFCAGANIKMLETVGSLLQVLLLLARQRDPQPSRADPEAGHRSPQRPHRRRRAGNRHGRGSPIAKKDAGKVGLPEVNLGVLPGTGGTQRLCRLVGKTRAIELMVTGQLLSFEDGKEMGVVNQIWDGDDFMDQIHQYATQFCPPNMASKAVGRIKRSVQSGAEVPFESGLAIEREMQQQLFQSKDAREGLTAYIEKRKADFSGDW